MGRSGTSSYILTPGRRIYALGHVSVRAKEGLPALLEPIDIAIDHDRKTLQQIAARFGSAKIPVRDHDIEVDRTLATIETLVGHYAKDPTGAALLSMLFPHGLQAHVQLQWVEQSAANERVLDILASETHKEWLDKRGVRPLIEELRTHHDAFAVALKARDAGSPPTGEEIKLARDLGQELYLEIVAQIIALSVGKPELRSWLLEPVWQQNQKVQVYRRQRRHVVDVDPETGEELPRSQGQRQRIGGLGRGCASRGLIERNRAVIGRDSA